MTIDYSRQGKRSRRKGDRGELEVRDILREYGYATAHRNFQSGGQGGGDLADAIPDVHLEVKRVENFRLGVAWKQANAGARPTDTVVIVHRGSAQPWMATLLLTDWAGLEAAASFVPRVISGSVRAGFLAHARDFPVRPLVVHQLGVNAMCTVLFKQWLKAFQQNEGAGTDG